MSVMFLFFLLIPVFGDSDCNFFERRFGLYFPYSFSVYEITKNKEIANCNKDLLLIPGSSLKIVTSLYVLEKLGGNFRFETKIYASKIIEGIVDKLVIVGGGDMTLGSSNFSSSIEKVCFDIYSLIKKEGIRKINRVVVLNSHKEFADGSVEWQDIGNYYSPVISLFSINDNSYRVVFSSGNIGDYAFVLDIFPKVKFLLRSEVVIGKPESGDNAYIYACPSSNIAFIKGSIPYKGERFEIKGALFEPDDIFLEYFVEYLRNNGLIIESYEVVKDIDVIGDTKLVGILYSPPVSEIIKVMNKKSFNFYADSLLSYSMIKDNIIGMDKNLVELSEFLRKNSIERFYVVDGSGLSRRNLFSAYSFTKLLMNAFNKGYFKTFYDSLPNKDDLMIKFPRLTDVKDINDIRIKTGSMSKIRSYCGYIKKDEKIYAFAFIFNNYVEDPNVIRDTVEDYLIRILK